ncbi:MAG: DNA cytosine methyltransferase, partial [Clostridia bacterium]|nr:DNA cytosine methyltransferase [Clostridia bacterium]
GRLQAFPVDDGWTQVVSNSQTYKQYGNAVTVTVAQSVAEAIKDYIDKINSQQGGTERNGKQPELDKGRT